MFVLVESVMNGTVTMENLVTIVDIEDFEKAKDKVKRTLSQKKKGIVEPIIEYIDDGEERLLYKIEEKNCGSLYIIGKMENVITKIIKG
jgi:hypothetical protein